MEKLTINQYLELAYQYGEHGNLTAPHAVSPRVQNLPVVLAKLREIVEEVTNERN